MDNESLSHTKWNCKYHIVFAPKYRRQVIYGKIKREIGRILRDLSERKGVQIIEAECCPDHIHMLVSIPPKISVASYMGYLNGKSSLVKWCNWAGFPGLQQGVSLPTKTNHQLSRVSYFEKNRNFK